MRKEKDLKSLVMKLKKNGFKIDKSLTTKKKECFVKNIPIWKQNKIPVLFATICISIPDCKMITDVYDYSGQVYAPYYNTTDFSAHKKFITKINTKIDKYLKGVGIYDSVSSAAYI